MSSASDAISFDSLAVSFDRHPDSVFFAAQVDRIFAANLSSFSM